MAKIVRLMLHKFPEFSSNLMLNYSYWDDWMRRPEQRKDRACIRPEISRTRTFGKIGVSK